MTHTKIQIEADLIDAEMYRLAGRLEAFAKIVKCPLIDEVSRRLFQSRGVVRKHMDSAQFLATETTNDGRGPAKRE